MQLGSMLNLTGGRDVIRSVIPEARADQLIQSESQLVNTKMAVIEENKKNVPFLCDSVSVTEGKNE